jgi:hypothetical protein
MEQLPPVELMLKSALPIDDVDRLLISPGEGISIVWVDISERPDLATLAAREASGDGYFIATWFYANPGKRNMIVGLRVDMCAPRRYTFHLAFKVEKFIDQLSTIAQYGRLWVIPGPPPAHLVGTQVMNFQTFSQQVIAYCGHGVALELEPRLVAELQSQLAGWRQAR